jgi:hypothetical protein
MELYPSVVGIFRKGNKSLAIREVSVDTTDKIGKLDLIV